MPPGLKRIGAGWILNYEYIYKEYLAGLILKGKEPAIGKEAIKKLLEAIDDYIPQPIRDLDKPFYLPIEQVFSIAGQ